MIDRRQLILGATIGTAMLSASSTSACSYMQFEEDEWGAKLIRYLKRGKEDDLNGLFQDFSTLVVFSPTYISGGQLSYSGRAAVQNAITRFRETLTQRGWVEPRKLVDAKIVGNEQQGRVNRIELLFAESIVSDTSCGPDRSEWRADLYYEAGVYEIGEDSVKWAVERMAIMPPLEIQKFP